MEGRILPGPSLSPVAKPEVDSKTTPNHKVIGSVDDPITAVVSDQEFGLLFIDPVEVVLDVGSQPVQDRERVMSGLSSLAAATGLSVDFAPFMHDGTTVAFVDMRRPMRGSSKPASVWGHNVLRYKDDATSTLWGDIWGAYSHFTNELDSSGDPIVSEENPRLRVTAMDAMAEVEMVRTYPSSEQTMRPLTEFDFVGFDASAWPLRMENIARSVFMPANEVRRKRHTADWQSLQQNYSQAMKR